MASASKGRKGKIGKHRAGIALYYGSGGRAWWNKARRLVHTQRHGKLGKDGREALTYILASMPGHIAKSFKSQYKLEA